MAETKYYAEINDWAKTILAVVGAYFLILLFLFALRGITCDLVCQDSLSVNLVGYLIAPIALIFGFWFLGIVVGINLLAFEKRIYFDKKNLKEEN